MPVMMRWEFEVLFKISPRFSIEMARVDLSGGNEKRQRV